MDEIADDIPITIVKVDTVILAGEDLVVPNRWNRPSPLGIPKVNRVVVAQPGAEDTVLDHGT